MRRIITNKRKNWKDHAEGVGFKLHTMFDKPYWNEGVYYEFTLDQVENDLEDPSTELYSMCLEAVDYVLKNEQLLKNMRIPEQLWDYIAKSWKTERDQSLYGRFDLAYNGQGPAKMLEYNADTPTSLYEAAAYQWLWLEQAIEQGILPKTVDQFNAIEDNLIRELSKYDKSKDFYFSSFQGSDEDYMTVEYMGYCAVDAQINPQYIAIQDISEDSEGQFRTPDGKLIEQIFMLYPWEDMLLDDYSRLLKNSVTKFVEPVWKTILSNKGILPVLWEMFPQHPNLLPAYFGEKHISSGYVTKPIYSREGSSIVIYKDGEIQMSDDRSYEQNGIITQGYVELPNFEGNRPVIGTWVVGNKCVGMGIREDENEITQDLSRFTPHIII